MFHLPELRARAFEFLRAHKAPSDSLSDSLGMDRARSGSCRSLLFVCLGINSLLGIYEGFMRASARGYCFLRIYCYSVFRTVGKIAAARRKFSVGAEKYADVEKNVLEASASD